jgi:hypothetical protein
VAHRSRLGSTNQSILEPRGLLMVKDAVSGWIDAHRRPRAAHDGSRWSFSARRSSSAAREDLLCTLVEFIAVLLAWCAAPFQLAFEQVTQQPQEPLTIGWG